MKRPGVATTISTPLRRSPRCSPMLVPPTTMVERTSLEEVRVKSRTSRSICCASSLHNVAFQIEPRTSGMDLPSFLPPRKLVVETPPVKGSRRWAESPCFEGASPRPLPPLNAAGSHESMPPACYIGSAMTSIHMDIRFQTVLLQPSTQMQWLTLPAGGAWHIC